MHNFDEEYINQLTPEKREKANHWRTAIGLQQVDGPGMKVSEYLIELAMKNIEGEITIKEVQRRLDEYYKNKKSGDSVKAK
jgi:hypothetical protein